MSFTACLCQLFLALFPLIQPEASISRCALDKMPKPEHFTVRSRPASTPKRPVLATALEKKYRTVIRQAASRGPNFAGHYVVAKWGCGTGCTQFVIIDSETGKVLDPPFREVDCPSPSAPSGHEAEWSCYPEVLNYSISSRLLTVEGCLAGHRGGRNYFLVNGDGLRSLNYDPDLSNDGKVAPF